MEYIKKESKTIKAIQFNGENRDECVNFMDDSPIPISYSYGRAGFKCLTCNPPLCVWYNDYIVKENDELYIYKEEDFENMYKPIISINKKNSSTSIPENLSIREVKSILLGSTITIIDNKGYVVPIVK